MFFSTVCSIFFGDWGRFGGLKAISGWVLDKKISIYYNYYYNLVFEWLIYSFRNAIISHANNACAYDYVSPLAAAKCKAVIRLSAVSYVFIGYFLTRMID